MNKKNIYILKLLYLFISLMKINCFSQEIDSISENGGFMGKLPKMNIYIMYETNLGIRYFLFGRYLIIDGFYKEKYKSIFIKPKYIKLEKIKDLEDYIERKNIWNLPEINTNDTAIVIQDPPFISTFVIVDKYNNRCKILTYEECYSQSLDSLMYYMNDLIPNHYKKQLNLNNEIRDKKYPPCLESAPKLLNKKK